MTSAASPRRFSLLSLLLLLTSVAATAGWVGALRQARDARREALTIRRELERHRAGVGELDVADFTRVHAVGLSLDSSRKNQWKWRVFVPGGTKSNLVLESADHQRAALTRGEHLITAYIREVAGQNWVHVAVDGLPQVSARLPWYSADNLLVSQVVGPDGRSVWETAERPVLIEAKSTPDETPRRFAIWIELLPEKSADKPGELESQVKTTSGER